MRYLLDTHVFIWMIADPDNLSITVKEIINDPSNELYLSSASGWEIVIKYQIGKLELPEEPEFYVLSQMKKNYIDDLPIRMIHSLQVNKLPDFHKDPFDRILIAQSMIENIPIITSDNLIKRYDVNIIW